MPFNSLPCLVFVVVVVAVYHACLRSWPARKHWLVAASWFFYATWSLRFLGLVVATSWVNFRLGRAIERARLASDWARARRLLVAGLALDLAPLAFFKYGGFLYTQIGLLAPLPPTPGVLRMAVPLGISFYTFHAISYLVDTYRGARPASTRFGDFALYLAFFPQLVAGPITRWSFFGPQLETMTRVDAVEVESAAFLIVKGLAKKVLWADALGGFVDTVYGDLGAASSLEIALAVYAYAFQIYLDFSAYTDIAKGLAQLFGLRLPDNFRHPYVAENPADFWRRWHISLSTWLRDYLYIPLGGNRRGGLRTYANLLVTMLLGGLWHGASWTFVLWGGLHGGWLALHRLLAWREGFMLPRSPQWLRCLVTFHLVAALWVVFRAPSLAAAGELLRGLVAARPLAGPFPIAPLALVLLAAVSHGLAERFPPELTWRRAPVVLQGAVYGLVVVLLGIFSEQSGRFIYFQF